VKLKEVHVVNVSPLVDTILNIVKPFLKEKIRNRVKTLLVYPQARNSQIQFATVKDRCLLGR
jgi:hypothetical protein